MNRKEIKELAKAKIKGNKWNLIWPMLIIGVISSIVSRLFGGTITIDLNNLESLSTLHATPMQYGGSILSSLITGLLTAGFMAYVLDFVRKGKFDTNKIIETIKTKWVNILIADILVTIIVSDTDKIVAVACNLKKKYLNMGISDKLTSMIERRESFVERKKSSIEISPGLTEYGYYAVATIINNGDSIGSVIILSLDTPMLEQEEKLAMILANILSNYFA